MLAARLTAVNDLKVEEVPTPSPGPARRWCGCAPRR